jgi:predicted RNA-binding protein with EMAP domain
MNIINSIKQAMSQRRSRKSFKEDIRYIEKVKFKYLAKKEKVEKEIFIKTGKTINELAAKEHVPQEYLDDLLHLNDILIKLNDGIIEISQYRIDILSGKINTMCTW